MIDEPLAGGRSAGAERLRDRSRRALLRRGLAALTGVGTFAGTGVGAAAGAWAPDSAVRTPTGPLAAAAPARDAVSAERPGAVTRSRVEGLAAFSRMAPGAPPSAPWREQTLRGIPANRCAVVEDEGRAVLQFDSDASASSLMHPVAGQDAGAVHLRWRWKTSGYPLERWLGEKRGDDYAARVYVLYDYPLDRVPLGQRMLLHAARAVHDPELPAAVLCYLLDPRAPKDTLLESPYSTRVRMIVVRSTPTTGRWWSEDRDLRADFARAFGIEYGAGVAPIRAIVIAADTDQSGAALTTRFGDLALETA